MFMNLGLVGVEWGPGREEQRKGDLNGVGGILMSGFRGVPTCRQSLL